MNLQNQKPRSFLKLLALPLAAAATLLSADAQTTISWSGNSSTTWSTGTNWAGDTAPANTIASSGNIARFSATTSERMPNITADRSVYRLDFVTRNWSLNSSAGVVLSLGAGGITVQSLRTVDLNTLINVNGGTWSVAADGILNVNRALGGLGATPPTLTKGGLGTMNLNANVSVGTLVISNGATVLGASNLLGDAMNLSSSTTATTGSLNLAGFSDSMATLTLNAGTLNLDFGLISGANSFSFTNSSALSWGAGNLLVQNFAVGTDTLRFGTDSSGLTSTQLAKITFTGYDPGAQIDSLGYLAPIPEPSSIALLGIAAGLGISRRRRK